MAKYIGETIRISTTLTNAVDGTAVTAQMANISIWPPDSTLPPVVNEASMSVVADKPGVYEYYWDSSLVSQVPGTYTFKVTATGSNFRNWEFGQVNLQANRR